MTKKFPRLGCVKYLNARPLIHGWDGPVDFDHPSALCRKLERGELDLALVSSIEYLRRPNYEIVDGVSISAFGPVYSVFVAHRKQSTNEIDEIEIDSASETSVALLRCLLSRPAGEARLVEKDASAKLIIGDQAIRFRQTHPEWTFWDLASAWETLTGLPFVFALWLVSPEIENKLEIADRLRDLRDQNLTSLEKLIAQEKEFAPEFCRGYWRENIQFSFGENEKAGLQEFHRRCLEAKIDVVPTFELRLV